MYVFVILLLALNMGCQNSSAPQTPEFVAPSGPEYPTEIRAARALGKLDLQLEGRVVGADCGVCHTEGATADAATIPGDLKDFHTQMQFGHGALTCNSCHNPEDRRELRLANGESLPFEQTMTLCAQCHGPQERDYRNGSHGGMSGYWDKTRGPRVRNHCVNCHDPHAPAFPAVIPAPPPRDRFMQPASEAH